MEEEAWLCSKLEEEGRMGSFVIHLDTQLKSLRRLVEEKQCVKMGKADDADTPLHLWDNRAPLPEAHKAESLQLLRLIGHRLFLCALKQDSVKIAENTHGECWPGLPKRNKRTQAIEVA